MQIGAIGAMPYMPYIYNTNTVTHASLNKISAINDDALASKTDFSNLTTGETTNPLKRGESLDFAGILSMQMQMGRMNAARVMVEPQKATDEEATQAAGIVSNDSGMSVAADAGTKAAIMSSVVSEPTEMTPVDDVENMQETPSAFDYAKALSAYQPIDLYA